MSIKHKIILINGEAGVGKSWLAKKLMQATADWNSFTHRTGKRVKFAGGIYRAVQAMYGIHIPVPLSKVDGDGVEDSFWEEWKKELRPDGEVNRKTLIDIGAYARSIDPDFWVKNLVTHVTYEDSKNLRGWLWICDDLGFPNEVQKLQAHEDFDCLTVYIGNNFNNLGDYRQFPNDSRFDLSRHCSIRAFNSELALEQVKTALTNRNW